MNHEFLYDTKLIYVILGILIILVGTSTISYHFGRKKTKAESSANDFLPTTILGLLALLLGFTFSMSISRFDARNNLVVKESNAIGTAYLQADIFSIDPANKYKELLKEYTRHRLNFFEDVRKNNDYTIESQKLQSQIWKQAVSMIQSERSAVVNPFMQANNDLIDVDAERMFASENHVPELVFYVIIIIAALGLGSLSYSQGLRQQRVVTSILLSILFSMVIVLIQDLDRPGRGLIQAHQESMHRLYDSLK